MAGEVRAWPAVPFNVVLVEPEIPPNTGNIARLCAATGSVLHLVGQLGFRLSDRELKRAGLDYWESVTTVRHADFSAFLATVDPARVLLFSANGGRAYTRAGYRPGDALVFGCESKGLPADIVSAHADRLFTIPVRKTAVRSLNLATAVGIVLYEALRQGWAAAGEPAE